MDDIGAEKQAISRPAVSEAARTAETSGLTATIWRWLRRILFRPWTHRTAPEKNADETVRESSPPFVVELEQPCVQLDGDASRNAVFREPVSMPPEEGLIHPPVQDNGPTSTGGREEDTEHNGRLESLPGPAASDATESGDHSESPSATLAEPLAAAPFPATEVLDELVEHARTASIPSAATLDATVSPSPETHRNPIEGGNATASDIATCTPEDDEIDSPAATLLASGAEGEAGATLTPDQHESGAADDAPNSDLSPIPDVSVPSSLSQTSEPRLPARYRPRLNQRGRAGTGVRTARAENTPVPETSGTLDAELVVMYRPGQWGIDLALLLRRGQAMAEELAIRLGPEAYDLCAISDDLFEPIAITDPAAALTAGVTASSIENPSIRWVRSGRDLHVFTAKAGVAGFVSVPRVIIGPENAAICTDEIADRVIRVCTAVAGAPPKEVFGPGIPAGWRCFRGIQPETAAAPDDCDDVLLALVPLPDATIEFSGGIGISRSAWISGYPPSIRILGATALPGDVSIDGRTASCNDSGDWITEGWESDGPHTVRYAGLSRNYEISLPPEAWDYWDAHAANGLTVCGALAFANAGKLIYASATGPVWLVGRRPGEIVQTLERRAASFTIAAPHFDPVWAVPIGLGRSRDDQLPRLIARASQPDSVDPTMPRTAIRLWCQVIRECVRNPKVWQTTEPQAAGHWLSFRQVARAAWRRSR